jgi:glyoxylase-like metal-dependent hydrolase (beta-lactamase superfamily II)
MDKGVAPSRLGTQPIGEVARVAEDIWQLKLPVPFSLRFVSVYLVEGNNGWTLVDSGYDYPPTYEVWEAGAATLGCDLGRDVARIVVTHFHPDHLGGARRLQEHSGAPVYMLEEEIPFSRKLWGELDGQEPFIEYLVRHGMPREGAESAATAMRSDLPLPEEMLPLRSEDRLPLGGGTARIIHAPGHADHQFVLHDEARGMLFAGDHVLLGITPNIGLWPESEPHPLASYLESLGSLRGLAANVVFPGHGPIFHNLDGRIDELLRHHEERLDLMRLAIEDAPKTPFGVSRAVFRDNLTLYERCFALAETLSHLDHLALEDRAERIEDGIVTYRAT